ncbi:MAG: DUF167 domain-containing protein [Candidatus Taylorbacteria bacterium]|nr:DUF167 domain-containing protein [Candidatus Taylorbacteria bacterium]
MYIKVTAKPDSREDFVLEKNGRFVVSTREPALDGRANAAVRALLARYLGVPEKSIALVRGTDRPSKLFIKRV